MKNEANCQPPRSKPFMAYVSPPLLNTDPEWCVCEWSKEEREFVHIRGRDGIGRGFFWIDSLPSPDQVKAAKRLLERGGMDNGRVIGLLSRLFG